MNDVNFTAGEGQLNIEENQLFNTGKLMKGVG